MNLEKVVSAGLTTQDRVVRSKEITNANYFNAGTFWYGYFTSNNGTTISSIEAKEGKWKCSCEDYWYSRNDRNDYILCKHTIWLLGVIDMAITKIYAQDEGNVTTRLPTDIKCVDNMLFGGIPSQYNTIFYSDWHVGKSILMQQIASKTWYDTGKPVLYIDTEGNWLDKEQRDACLGWFKERYGKDKLPQIYYVFPKSIEELFEYFGMRLALTDTGTKKKAVFPDLQEDGTLKKDKKFYSERDNYAMKDIIEQKCSAIIVDSLSFPLKGRIPTPPNENFPTRARVMDAILSRTHYIAVSQNIPSIITSHLSKDTTMGDKGKASVYGGQGSGFNVKWMVYLKGGKGDVSTHGFANRVFQRARTPSFPQMEVGVKLQKDYGYTDYPTGK